MSLIKELIDLTIKSKEIEEKLKQVKQIVMDTYGQDLKLAPIDSEYGIVRLKSRELTSVNKQGLIKEIINNKITLETVLQISTISTSKLESLGLGKLIKTTGETIYLEVKPAKVVHVQVPHEKNTELRDLLKKVE